MLSLCSIHLNGVSYHCCQILHWYECCHCELRLSWAHPHFFSNSSKIVISSQSPTLLVWVDDLSLATKWSSRTQWLSTVALWSFVLKLLTAWCLNYSSSSSMLTNWFSSACLCRLSVQCTPFSYFMQSIPGLWLTRKYLIRYSLACQKWKIAFFFFFI